MQTASAGKPQPFVNVFLLAGGEHHDGILTMESHLLLQSMHYWLKLEGVEFERVVSSTDWGCVASAGAILGGSGKYSPPVEKGREAVIKGKDLFGHLQADEWTQVLTVGTNACEPVRLPAIELSQHLDDPFLWNEISIHTPEMRRLKQEGAGFVEIIGRIPSLDRCLLKRVNDGLNIIQTLLAQARHKHCLVVSNPTNIRAFKEKIFEKNFGLPQPCDIFQLFFDTTDMTVVPVELPVRKLFPEIAATWGRPGNQGGDSPI